MRKLTILIDCDDTINDLLPTWVSYLNKKFGTNVDYKKIFEWNMEKYFPSIKKDDIYYPLSLPEFWETVQAKYGMVNVLEQLLEDGHDVFITTASHCDSIKPKMERMVFKHFPFLTWDNIIIVQNKHMVKGDVLVDDGIHNHIGNGIFNKNGSRGLNILMSAPHNKYCDLNETGIIRAENGAEVYKTISAFAMYTKE